MAVKKAKGSKSSTTKKTASKRATLTKQASAKPKAKTVAVKKENILRPKNAPRSIKAGDVNNIRALIKAKQSSVHIYRGRLCLFYTMNNKFGNESTEEGFICGIRHDYQSVPQDVKQPLIASIFAHEKSGEDYNYYGDVNYIVYEDEKRNKMLWG